MSRTITLSDDHADALAWVARGEASFHRAAATRAWGHASKHAAIAHEKKAEMWRVILDELGRAD